ncbi:MAG: hypothetical protein ACTH31_15225, partial [Pseudoclavibacter sp.]
DAPAAVESSASPADETRGPSRVETVAPSPAVPAPVTAPPIRASNLPASFAAPSLRPAMPLSDHPNFAGLGLAQPDAAPPRLLEPEAALSDEARDELTGMLLDMFGPTGRYRLEWRADRTPGDDAMFSEIMVADLVRRIQNSIAVASDLELRAAPLRLAIEAMHERQGAGAADAADADADAAAGDAESDADERSEREAETANTGDTADAEDQAETDVVTDAAVAAADAEADEAPAAEHAAAISEFLSPSESLSDLAASTEPPARPHLGMRDADERRIA